MTLKLAENQQNTAIAAADGEALLACAATLHERVRALQALAEEKLVGLRGADTAALYGVASREAAALEQLFATEREQEAILARVAQSLPGSLPARPRLSDVATFFFEPLRSQINAKIAGLRSATEKLRQTNRRAVELAQHLHTHIREVFAEVAKIGRKQAGYDGRGQHRHEATRQWVDAVG